MMRVYHRTYHADTILRDGFKDSTGIYLTANTYAGVWFSDQPLDENEGADGDVLLALEIPEGLFGDFEWEEEGKPYREALIPADEVNQYGPPTIVEDSGEGP